MNLKHLVLPQAHKMCSHYQGPLCPIKIWHWTVWKVSYTYKTYYWLSLCIQNFQRKRSIKHVICKIFKL